MKFTACDALLRQALSSAPIPWPSNSTMEDERRFLKLSKQHRIQPLLYERLQLTGSLEHWPDAIICALSHASRLGAVADALVQTELPRVLSALSLAGIVPILMKGTPLSYTHYPAPNLRPRGDIDLLIRKQDVQATEAIMKQLGYKQYSSTRGEFVSHQVLYRKKHNAAISFDFDFHWKVCNPQIFADLISYDDALKTAISIPALGEHARGLSPPTALFLACIHRVGHHHDEQRLIWLYDIHLLVNRMSRKEFEEFAALAAEKQMKAVCLAGLSLSKDWFGTNVPADIVDLYFDGADSEPSGRFLEDLKRVDLLKLDLSQLSALRKFRLLYEHLFPPADFMLQRYAVSSRLLLPALYFHRAVSGMRSWFGKSRALS